MHRLALTFDDGPADGTEALLELLARFRVVATFFVEGRRAETPDGARLVRRMLAEGHLVGNHGYSHARRGQPGFEADEYAGELLRTDAILGGLGVPPPLWHRLPYGVLDPDPDPDPRPAALDRLGRASIGWSIDSQDWNAVRPGVRGGAERIEEYVRMGLDHHPPATAIILFHNHRMTADALERLLPEWTTRELCRVDGLSEAELFAPHVHNGHRPRK